MRKPAPSLEKPPIVRMRVVALVAAIVLSVVAGFQAVRVWLRLPGVQVARIDADAFRQALRAAQGRMSAQAREGQIAANISSLFTAAWQAPGVYEARRDDLQDMLSRLRHTQLGRLQLAAFLMLDLERRSTPPEQWWPVVEPVLSGLDGVTFAHFLAELLAHWTRILQAEPIRLGPGTARDYARARLGNPHGPLLQFFVDRLQRLASTRRGMNDGSAAVCERIVHRLLRQWVLEPGPVRLRLLAADLLAESLTGAGTTSAPAVNAELAEELRQWRAAYHEAAARLPTSSPPVGIGFGPEWRGKTYAYPLSLIVWAAALTLAAALTTAVCSALCLPTMLRLQARKRHAAGALCVAALLLAVWFVWTALDPGLTTDDLRRWASDQLGLPRMPFIAGGLTVVLLMFWAVWPPGRDAPRRARLGRVAVVALWTWLWLGLALLPINTYARLLTIRYESATAKAGGEYECVVGRPADAELGKLRAWQP